MGRTAENGAISLPISASKRDTSLDASAVAATVSVSKTRGRQAGRRAGDAGWDAGLVRAFAAADPGAGILFGRVPAHPRAFSLGDSWQAASGVRQHVQSPAPGRELISDRLVVIR
jgi:hypothetical protein